jgi:hypothetical protein
MTLFLVVTTSIEDILLNAVALEFVLNIDELLYLSLAPMKTRRLILLLKHIPIKQAYAWKGLDLNAFVAGVFTVSFLAAVFGFLMIPEMDRMMAAKSEMCEGFKEFSYTMTATGSASWCAELNSDRTIKSTDLAISNLRQSRRYYMIRGIIRSNFTEIFGSPWIGGFQGAPLAHPNYGIFALSKAPFEYFARNSNNRCEDILNPEDVDRFKKHLIKGTDIMDWPVSSSSPSTLVQAFAGIQDATGDVSDDFRNCEDFKTLCNVLLAPGAVVRLFCPATCGCDNPGSTLVFAESQEGCSSFCQYLPRFVTSMNKRTCTQPLDSELVSNPIFLETMSNLAMAGQTIDVQEFVMAAGLLSKMGCSAQLFFSSIGFSNCISTAGLKPLTWVCPATCECNTSTKPYCPWSCVIGQPVPTQSIDPGTLR